MAADSTDLAKILQDMSTAEELWVQNDSCVLEETGPFSKGAIRLDGHLSEADPLVRTCRLKVFVV